VADGREPSRLAPQDGARRTPQVRNSSFIQNQLPIFRGCSSGTPVARCKTGHAVHAGLPDNLLRSFQRPFGVVFLEIMHRTHAQKMNNRPYSFQHQLDRQPGKAARRFGPVRRTLVSLIPRTASTCPQQRAPDMYSRIHPNGAACRQPQGLRTSDMP